MEEAGASVGCTTLTSALEGLSPKLSERGREDVERSGVRSRNWLLCTGGAGEGRAVAVSVESASLGSEDEPDGLFSLSLEEKDPENGGDLSHCERSDCRKAAQIDFGMTQETNRQNQMLLGNENMLQKGSFRARCRSVFAIEETWIAPSTIQSSCPDLWLVPSRPAPPSPPLLIFVCAHH